MLFETDFSSSFIIYVTERFKRTDDRIDDLVMVIQPGVGFTHTVFYLRQGELKAADGYEHSYDHDAHLDGELTVQDIRSLDDTMLRESPR